MEELFAMYSFICVIIISIIIILWLISLAINVFYNVYEKIIDVGTFKKFWKKYHSEMMREKMITPKTEDIKFVKKE